MVLNIEPLKKPRISYRGKWKPSVQKYYEYANTLRELVPKDYAVPEKLSVKFYITMPKSWSSKKRAQLNGKPHTQRPDVDNLLKAYLDALCEEDSYVYAVRAEKYWTEQGRIEVESLD